jgi:hypothetical protein
MSKVLYRCDWKVTNPGEAESFEEQEIEVVYKEFAVIKETDKTYTVSIGKLHNGKYGDESKTIVLKDQSGKRFAYATKERALEAFIIRRRSYGGRLRSQIENNNRLIKIAKELQGVKP